MSNQYKQEEISDDDEQERTHQKPLQQPVEVEEE